MAKRTFIKALIPIAVVVALVIFGMKYLHRQETPAKPDEIKVGAVLPDLTLNKYPSGEVRISELNKKILLINFWASWCQSCLVEMPSLMKLRAQFVGQGFDIAAINVDEKPAEAIPGIVARLKLDLPLYQDTDTRLGNFFDIHGIPLSIIIDSSRTILHIESGDRDWFDDETRQLIEKWLKK